jgi:tRNA pseudouridine32 synthase/23S rRNA pseudouridine746 synthase
LFTSSTPVIDQFFAPFGSVADGYALPEKFMLTHNGVRPHPLCLLAARRLQLHLQNQKDWYHNFGLAGGNDEGTIIGKMFGVLIVKTQANAIGYLAAFSGKLAGGNHHARFVPPVFDSLTEKSFVNVGMAELTRMNKEIQRIENDRPATFEEQVKTLKVLRRQHSVALQNQIFDNYFFFEQARR